MQYFFSLVQIYQIFDYDHDHDCDDDDDGNEIKWCNEMVWNVSFRFDDDGWFLHIILYLSILLLLFFLVVVVAYLKVRKKNFFNLSLLNLILPTSYTHTLTEL